MLRHRSDLEKHKEVTHLDWPTGCLHHLGEMRGFRLQRYCDGCFQSIQVLIKSIIKKRKSCLILLAIYLVILTKSINIPQTRVSFLILDICTCSKNRPYFGHFAQRGSKNHFAALQEHSSVLTYKTKSDGYSPGEIREPVDYTTCS